MKYTARRLMLRSRAMYKMAVVVDLVEGEELSKVLLHNTGTEQ